MSRRASSAKANRDQIDLFGGALGQAAANPAPAKPAVRLGFGGKADAALEVLDQVHNGRYGRIEDNERIVYLDGENRCRHALDADAVIVESLLRQRYVKPTYVETMRHGAIAKLVEVLAPTTGGLGLLTRSSVLRTKGPR